MKSASLYTPEEPISAIATALAPGALGIVRVSGKNAIELIANVFSRPKALLNAAGYTMVHGWIIDGNSKIDEVMLGVYKAPKSFTGEDMIEIFCHGGTSPVLAIHSLLCKKGFREAQHGEFTFRSFVNGKTDLTRAEAIREIIDSKTDESRSRAAGRLAGNLFDEIESIKMLIVRTVASIEAEIEYPEDEEAIANAFDDAELLKARDALLSLSKSWSSEKLFQDGARIVLCGRTNAGKSSLFNTLLKEDRAIVSDIEGTTRDFIESWISFDGIPARLFDTAGLRETKDLIEQSGVERSLELADDADIVLYLLDSTVGFTSEDKAILENLKATKAGKAPLILVWNKADKQTGDEQLNAKESMVKQSNATTKDVVITQSKVNQLLDEDKELFSKLEGEVYISAKTGLGVSSLIHEVKALLSNQSATSREQAGLGSARQKASVDEALASVEHAIKVETEDYLLDAVVQDLEDALEALSEVTGEVSPDDILENIFSRFCVGK